MADGHRCPTCGAGVPRGAGFCPSCGTALNAPELPIETGALGSAVTEQEVMLGGRRPSPKRSALVVGVVAVVLLSTGLVVGAGSDGDDEEGASPTTTSTTAPSTTRPTPTTRTTVRRTTTTATIPSFSASPMPELAGATLYASVEGRVLRIDSSTGVATVLGDGSRQPLDGGLVARQGGVVVAGGERALFYPDDGSPDVELGRGFAMPASDPTLVWLVSFPRTVEPSATVTLLRVATGEALGALDVPSSIRPVGDDGTGRFLVLPDTGGTYAVDVVSGVIARLQNAQVLAVTETHWIQRYCDDALACRVEIVDRTTGAASPLGIGDDAATYYSDYDIAPGGTRVAHVEYRDDGPHLSIVDALTGGVSLRALSFEQSGPISWTADGNYLAWAGAGSIMVWSGDGEPIRYLLTESDGDPANATTAVVVGL